ncbi:MAG: TonB family protein [bacterium]|nr:TonB family protein [bacterium]
MKFALTIAILILSAAVDAQRIAIVEPEGATVEGLASRVRTGLVGEFKIQDDSMAQAAFRSVTLPDPFNLATSEARQIGEVLGVSDYILLRSTVQRRASIGRPAYFEAYAIAYVVDARTGSIIGWLRESVEAPTENQARDKILSRTSELAENISGALKMNRFSVTRDSKFQEVPPEDSPLAKGLRTPVPYRRLRPEYTELASSYGVRATVDIEVDIDADGSIARTSIERWAGFGLEESVEKAVRSMNWRPAERNGKPLRMRILLRYNFIKVEKDEAP